MAAQPENSQTAPSAQVVGNAFVEQYYQILHHSPELVFRFYQDTSVLSRPDANGHVTTVTTMKDINEKICSLDYKNYKAEIETADAQVSFKDGVVVLVTGCLTGKDNRRRKFTQTFFLAPQDKGYYVYNDIFRYVEASEPDSGTVASVGTEDLPLAPTMEDLEPQHVVDPKPTHETSPIEEVETINAEKNRWEADEGQAILDRDFVVEAKPHVNESPMVVAAEEAEAVSQEDAPKKSYASIVTTKKGPTKVYVPANTKQVPSTKAEKPSSVNPSAEAQVSEGSAAASAPPVEETETTNARDEVEGHSIYVRNLPMNVTVPELEAEFNKFGPIKPNGVQVRSNKQQGVCFGFVEFLDFSSMQNAIKASPITIGDRQASAEIKRATNRVGSGRFASPRGGFRSESFRGRGNFVGGRTYARNDNFRGRGSFNGRRGGEGYQQQQARGGRGAPRSSGPTQTVAST